MKIMLNREGILFTSVIVFFGVLFLIQLFFIGFLILDSKRDKKKDLIISRN